MVTIAPSGVTSNKGLIATIEFSLFGFSYTGPDICGFFGEAEREMCMRWQQMAHSLSIPEITMALIIEDKIQLLGAQILSILLKQFWKIDTDYYLTYTHFYTEQIIMEIQ